MTRIALADGRGLWLRRRTRGSRPAVYLHGAAADGTIWGHQLAAVPADNIALDLPGHGRSDGPGRARIADYAADVLAALDALDVPRAVLVGHSMGGAIALQLTLDHADRVAGLVLVGTGARLRVTAALRDLWRTDPAAARAALVAASYAPARAAAVDAVDGDGDDGTAGMVASPTERAAAHLGAGDPAVAAGDFAACHAFDVMDRLAAGAVRCPTAVVVGAADVLTPPKYGAWLAEHIAGASLDVVAGAGHMVMLEAAGAVTAVVTRIVT